MENADPALSVVTIDLPDERATAAFAEDVAACLVPGDVVALRGGLGAGKTTFARALIRALADDPALEVPSPTFTLVQTYTGGRLAIAHFDLYRIAGSADIEELGFGDALLGGAALVEWPERAEDALPSDRLDIAFTIAGAGRNAAVSGSGPVVVRFARSRAARALLDRSDWAGAARRHLQGDASSRTYERIHADERTAVLMDWPPQGQLMANDPRAAFRARDARAFLAVDNALRGAGLSAPEIYAADAPAGLVLMEDFGADGIVFDGQPVAERYRAVADVLAEIHNHPRPDVLALPAGGAHRLIHFSGAALLPELSLFADAYVPYVSGAPLLDTARSDLTAIWRDLDTRLQASEQSWVLFDVQSPNLFWLPERAGIARVGLIDFQDMFIGPAAYDVACLCQDARVTIPEALEAELIARYLARRGSGQRPPDAESFRAAFAISASLRTLKNLGFVARHAAAGNDSYVRHLPRLRAYLARALMHPVLSPLALWYERHLTSRDQAPA